MPYIKKDRRFDLDNFGNQAPQNAGELNYLFTGLAKDYFNRPDGGNYQAINDIVGALEGAKLEFTRRVTNPYEDSKIKSNGDVYE